MRTILAYALFGTVLVSLGPARAHVVDASSAMVTVADGRVEILQTTSAPTARLIVSEFAAPDAIAASTTEEAILAAMAAGWKVAADGVPCALKRHAYRAADHEQLQLRYLFQCPGEAAPTILKADWLMAAPRGHFMILTLSIDGASETVVFQRQPVSIALTGGDRAARP